VAEVLRDLLSENTVRALASSCPGCCSLLGH
jgi:hypothetical protein